MSSERILVSRKSGLGRVVHTSLVEAVGRAGPWLAVAPHDDDAVLGLGLTAAIAASEGIELHVAIATDGRMGYWREEDRASIIVTRRSEMERCAAELGIPSQRIHWLGFPDGELMANQGCRPPGDARGLGLGQALTRTMRSVRPRIVFGPTPEDLHPDHRAVASELDIACFWASGEIWSELGAPIELPARWDYAVYCAFPGDPTVRIQGSEADFAKKLRALEAFASQTTIATMVSNLRAAGPIEFLQEATWKLYAPKAYEGMFGQ